MAGPTVIGVGDPKAVRKWSGNLFVDITKKSYFKQRFVGESDNAVIQRLTDLETGAGDKITFDLSVQLRGKPTPGDNRLLGKEEALRFYSDELAIDQLRKAVSGGGRMTRKRTLHNLRNVAKSRLSDYWSKYFDELFFIYLSGARGINQDFTEDLTYVGHAGNAIEAPDSSHILYGGDATAKNNVDSADKMTKKVIERAVTKAAMMRATNPNLVDMQPVMIDGAEHFVCLMSEYQQHDMKTADTTGWMEINKALITAEGRKNEIFKGGLGMVNNVVLHAHKNAIRFSDYGSGSDVAASRALFMGRQAAVLGFGSAGKGYRFDWSEEKVDHGNEVVIASGTIFGISKTRFNSTDFGVMAIDTAAADPG